LLSSNARVIEERGGPVILELVGRPEEIDHAIGSLARASILEIVRGGQLLMARGLQKTSEELSLRL
jgi:acetolactate synthase small subunit